MKDHVLYGWNEIAGFLRRTRQQCQRYETLFRMPVFREGIVSYTPRQTMVRVWTTVSLLIAWKRSLIAVKDKHGKRRTEMRGGFLLKETNPKSPEEFSRLQSLRAKRRFLKRKQQEAQQGEIERKATITTTTM